MQRVILIRDVLLVLWSPGSVHWTLPGSGFLYYFSFEVQHYIATTVVRFDRDGFVLHTHFACRTEFDIDRS